MFSELSKEVGRRSRVDAVCLPVLDQQGFGLMAGVTPEQLRMAAASKSADAAFHHAWKNIAPSVGASAQWGKARVQCSGPQECGIWAVGEDRVHYQGRPQVPGVPATA